ncbi:hypothetical protein Ddye_030039 [Dipteronia dyeriana]|uniref:Reticulon-like protein n=1 Tax=Dipteronia dyeriana TaxID=168575 RepID=A0AAD9TG92_9ROSI|nr:hypothetical protein Ddye_030039 [Dipteronia dyeriana]
MSSGDRFDSDDQHAPSARSFGFYMPLHDILGGVHVADILLWKNKKLSCAVLTGATLIWLLFEVLEYHFITLLCHILCILMIILFIWSKAADLIKRSPPNADELILSQSTCQSLFGNINWLLMEFYEISCGKNLKHYFLTIVFLWILSVIGEFFSFISLLYFAFLCLETLPALYVRYQEEVDSLAGKSTQEMKRFLNYFKSKVLDKIPKAPANKKKYI